MGLLGRRRRTLVERISLPTPPLLTHLVRNKHLPHSRPPSPTQRKTTAEALGVKGDEAKTHLQRTSTPPQRKEKISPNLSAFTAERRAILPTCALKRRNRSQKLVSVSATSTSMTGTSKEGLERISCIYYPVQFKDTDKALMQALIDSGSEVNAIHLFFVKQLGLPIRLTDVGVQKIDSTMLDTHRMVVAAFSVEDQANQVRFFEETFLVTNVSPKVVLEMPFFNLSGADVDFSGWELR